MSGPFFDIAVAQLTRVNLRIVLGGDSGRLVQFAASILSWFGDEYLASPRLGDLLHVPVCRIGDPRPIFDSIRDGVEPLCLPTHLLAETSRRSGLQPSDQHTIELVVLESSPSVDAPAPDAGDRRMVWLIGDGAFDVLPAVHKRWSAHRTIADEAADGVTLRRVCTDLVRAATAGAAPTPTERVESAAVSRLLGGTGPAAG